MADCLTPIEIAVLVTTSGLGMPGPVRDDEVRERTGELLAAYAATEIETALSSLRHRGLLCTPEGLRLLNEYEHAWPRDVLVGRNVLQGMAVLMADPLPNLDRLEQRAVYAAAYLESHRLTWAERAERRRVSGQGEAAQQAALGL